MNSHEFMLLLLSLAVLLATARLFGELAERAGQPTVLGEILAGIVLGPTALGYFLPDWHAALFPAAGDRAVVLSGFFNFAIVLFMLVAGMEVDLSSAWRQGKTAVWVGTAGILLPFAVGFLAAWGLPDVLGYDGAVPLYIFALFIATALSISALPVIARTLMDLGLYYGDFGMIVIAAAVLSDIAGWILFAIILGLTGAASGPMNGVGTTILLTLAYAFAMLTLGRVAIHRALPWLQAHTSWPGGVLGMALSIALLGAAFTEWAGVHAIFGAFLAGVAIGDSSHLRNHTRTIISQFVSFIFAPLFFASIGLKVNFAVHFDWAITAAVLVLACVSKILACGAAGRLAGVDRRQSLALGFALNARGAMEIILGMLALEHGIINPSIFVALVIMALATSVMSGLFIPRILRQERARKLADYLSPKAFVPELSSSSMRSAIEEVSKVVANAAGVDPHRLADAVWDREELASTALGKGVAVPHARMDDAASFVVGAAIAPKGIDFNAPDGAPVHVVFLMVSPRHDTGAQLQVLADIAERFRDPDLHEKAANCTGFTEFLALIKTQGN